jgi:predicted NodU family carbamoyl transferase
VTEGKGWVVIRGGGEEDGGLPCAVIKTALQPWACSRIFVSSLRVECASWAGLVCRRQRVRKKRFRHSTQAKLRTHVVWRAGLENSVRHVSQLHDAGKAQASFIRALMHFCTRFFPARTTDPTVHRLLSAQPHKQTLHLSRAHALHHRHAMTHSSSAFHTAPGQASQKVLCRDLVGLPAVGYTLTLLRTRVETARPTA